MPFDLVVMGEAANGAEVLERLQQRTCDLLLLDLNMPGISGADLIARVKAHHHDLPVLVLSMHNDPQVAARMLKAGASGYITKDCEPEVLLAAVRTVAAHGNYIDPAIACQMVFAASERRFPDKPLTERELTVLGLLTQGQSVKEIGNQLAISNKTVSTHKARLMEKLNIANMAELMRYAIAHESPD